MKNGLLIQPQQLPSPDWTHFENHQEYYSDNVNTGLEAWFYLQVMNYLSKHTPIDLMREDWVANKTNIYNLYVDKCKDLNAFVAPLKDLEHELEEILEVRSDTFKFTEFDPDYNNEES